MSMCTSVNPGTSVQLNDLVMPSTISSAHFTSSPGSTRSVAPSLTLPCSSFLLYQVPSCSLRDSPTHYRIITTAKFLPNRLGLLLSKWAHLWFPPPDPDLYWGRAMGPWPHSSWNCYSLHKMLSLLSAVSKILLHFHSQNSIVAAYASERATEYSETTFGLGRAEESWSLGACQVRSILSSHFVLLFLSISPSGTHCCCVSLLGLLGRLITLLRRRNKQTRSWTENQIITGDDKWKHMFWE